jgi:hypothetical protein
VLEFSNLKMRKGYKYLRHCKKLKENKETSSDKNNLHGQGRYNTTSCLLFPFYPLTCWRVILRLSVGLLEASSEAGRC